MATSKRSSSFPGKSIVVGVDAEGLSDHAVRLGFDLGRRLSVPVHMVHAVPEVPDIWPGIDPAQSTALSAELLDGARKTITRRVKAAAGARAGGSTRSAGRGRSATAVAAPKEWVRIVEGHPAKVLIEEARLRKAGLVVLGPHRKKKLFDLSNTVRAVLARSSVPVWSQSLAARPIRRILAGIDLSHESLSALTIACALAKAFDASVLGVHFFDAKKLSMYVAPDPINYAAPLPIDEMLRAEKARFEKAMKRFDWMGVAHKTEMAEGEPEQGLLDRSSRADLVVLGTHGRTGLASVVLGSVAYAVLKRSKKPVVVVPHPKRKFKL